MKGRKRNSAHSRRSGFVPSPRARDSATMQTLVIRIDRRAEVLDDLLDELRQLQDTVVGLEVEFAELAIYEAARDEGKFRDFVEVAVARHEKAEVLQWLAEELVDEFGWLVDVGPDR